MKRKQLRFGEGFQGRSSASSLTSGPDGDRAGQGGRRSRVTGIEARTSGSTSFRAKASPNRQRNLPLQAGTLLLIRYGDRHEIRNNGSGDDQDLELLRAAGLHEFRWRTAEGKSVGTDDNLTGDSYC